MAFTLKNLTDLTNVAVNNGASDIHIRTGEAPCLRIKGNLVPVKTNSLSSEHVMDICKIIFQNDELYSNIDDLYEYDGSFDIPDTCRLRYNFFRYNKKCGVILRIINTVIPTIENLEFSCADSIRQIADQRRGLILVTGATGSGKSTTLAAMINHINETRSTHIVTIEDPIEYLHTQKQSRISQREVRNDTESFSSGLHSALRQDPDIILIGEMRDPETISIALKAAETGHLVFSTVHTTNAVSTIHRIISMFPPNEQQDVRKRISDGLYATISQRLLPGTNSKKLLPIQEVMITNPGIKECILGEEPLQQINANIEQGFNQRGTQSFDQDIMQLYQNNLISKETALSAAASQSDFLQKLIVD